MKKPSTPPPDDSSHLEDAFACTDPERVQSLQRMLDLAATRGLQIILLTCTPNDYSAFGAGEIRLP